MGGSFISRGMAIAVTAISFTSGAWARHRYRLLRHGNISASQVSAPVRRGKLREIPDADAKLPGIPRRARGFPSTACASLGRRNERNEYRAKRSPTASRWKLVLRLYGAVRHGRWRKRDGSTSIFSQGRRTGRNSILKFSGRCAPPVFLCMQYPHRANPDDTSDNPTIAQILSLSGSAHYLEPTLDTTGIR